MDLYRKADPTQTCIEPALVVKNQRVGAAAASAEEDLLTLWIRAAERLVESGTNRSIMRSTYQLRVPALRSEVTLFRPGMDDAPVTIKKIEVVSFSRSGHAYDVAEEIDVTEQPRQRMRDMLPVIYLPTVRESDTGEMLIEYEAGQDVSAMVGADVRQAVLFIASHYYRNREAVVTDQRRGTGQTLPWGVEALIGGRRIPNVNMPVNEGRPLDLARFR